MRTKKLLSTATAETAQAAIDQAIALGWTPASISRHGNKAVRAALKLPSSQTVAAASALATPRSKGKAKAKKVKRTADRSKAQAVSFGATFAPYHGGETVEEAVTGQYPITGIRGGVHGQFTTASGRQFRLSKSAFERLTNEKQTVLAWVDANAMRVTLA